MKYVFEPLIGEKWTAIKEFDEYYISSFGRIWSQKKKPMFLNTYPDKYGYHHVKFRKDGKQYSRLVHRLVAEAFVDNPNNYKEVNHKDEDKSNNRADNLEWCTRTYNILYGIAGKERYEKMKITQRYSRNDLKPVECLDPATGNVLHKFKSVGEAARVLFNAVGSKNHIRSNIISCCRNRGHVKTVMGYKWRYANV